MRLAHDERTGTADVVQFGRTPRQRRRWAGSALLACLVGAAAVVVVLRAGGPPKPSPPPPVTVRDVGHPILGIRGGYELFGLEARRVVAVQFARGQIVQTRIPPLQSYGPISFVAAQGETIVRPLDNVPGYVVPDGKPARRLTGVLAHGGILLPGPSLSQEWLDHYNPGSLQLIGPDGKPEPIHLRTPSGRLDGTVILETALPGAPQPPLLAMPDGRGGVVLVDSGEVQYDTSTALLRPVGELIIAVGPTSWLGMSCQHGHCRDVVTSTASGATRTLPGRLVAATPWTSPPGATSPDGTTATVVVLGTGTGPSSLELINLRTGGQTVADVPVGSPSANQVAWSPDGRWLFVITAAGKLAAIDARTGQVRDLGLGLAGLSQILIRPAGG